ncbi:hypothetical protein VP01_1467g3 [Puccinia sorghi]|uniref:Integrase core domain-containing protein n=1 Tax=Puccinia sorghi TaxID=27349 RepID=A0A0L6VLL3_9BASI|nr:hypothetical protein VP01_1467g3 [Puccinia sorghi]
MGLKCHQEDPQKLVYDILKEVDPEGMTARLCQTCKCCVFCTYCPNHIWSFDGHDKLKRFGITVYGFIDAWSRKILGMFVHVTNNNPRHIGVYFLQIAFRWNSPKVNNQRSIQMYAFHQQHNRSIIDNILTQIENKICDPDDTLHKLLFNPAWKSGLTFKIIIESGETTPSQPQLLALHTLHTVLQNILAPPIDLFQSVPPPA